MHRDPIAVFNEWTKHGAHGAEPQVLTVTHGRVPPELSGVLYRNGPGRLRVYGSDYDHLFDGDGFVQRFEFADGGVRYRSRYVETPSFRQEERAGRMLYRSFGTNRPGGLLGNALRTHFKNAANTSVLRVGDDLLALWEGGAPFAIDPETLACHGRWFGSGELRSRTAVERLMRNGRPFSAHPKVLAGEETIYNFGLSPGLRQRLLLHRIDRSTGRIDTTEAPLPRLTFMHDFVATASGTRIFYDVGVSFHLNAALLGLKPPAATIHGDSDAQTVVRLFDRHDVQHVVPGPPGYVFHLPNGYESGSQIVVDGCWLERFPDGADIRAMLNDRPPSAPFRPVLMRHVIDVARGRVEAQVLSDYVMELPSINPAVRGREHRYVWGVAEPAGRDTAAVMFGIAKVDTERRETLYADYYPLILGEPLFVDPSFGGAFEAKAAGEDQGYLLILAFDPRGPSGVLLILAADTLVEHARVLLPEPVHIGFHGLWEAR